MTIYFNQSTGEWEEEKRLPGFEIWSEGFAATGDSGTAIRHGAFEGENFRDACLRFFERYPSKYFNPQRLTFWGCRLFDNEMDARKSFG